MACSDVGGKEAERKGARSAVDAFLRWRQGEAGEGAGGEGRHAAGNGRRGLDR
jgi:hypothetical protein